MSDPDAVLSDCGCCEGPTHLTPLSEANRPGRSSPVDERGCANETASASMPVGGASAITGISIRDRKASAGGLSVTIRSGFVPVFSKRVLPITSA